MNVAIGSIVLPGQNVDHPSKVLRPRITASCVAIAAAPAASTSTSSHSVNNPSTFSATPSRDMNS
jgi:hypothetical protein